MAPTKQTWILLARAKARAGASKVEARAFIKATRADGRVSRPEAERPEEEKQEECMGTKADLEAKLALIVARKATFPPIAHCPKCAPYVGAKTTCPTIAPTKEREKEKAKAKVGE